MDEGKNQINDLEHKEAKSNQPEQEEKRIQKKMRIVLAASGTTLSCPTFTSQGCQKRGIENLLEKIMKENFPNLA